MKKFIVGESYSGRFICNSDSKFTFKIVKRTEKTVTIKNDLDGEIKRCKIHNFENIESIYPLGKYSMCPVLHA